MCVTNGCASAPPGVFSSTVLLTSIKPSSSRNRRVACQNLLRRTNRSRTSILAFISTYRRRKRSSLLVSSAGSGRKALVRSLSALTPTEISPVLVLMTLPVTSRKSPVSRRLRSVIPIQLDPGSVTATESACKKSCICPLISRSTINANLPNLRSAIMRPATVTVWPSSSSNLTLTSWQSCVRFAFDRYGLNPRVLSSLSLRRRSSL